MPPWVHLRGKKGLCGRRGYGEEGVRGKLFSDVKRRLKLFSHECNQLRSSKGLNLLHNIENWRSTAVKKNH